MIRMDDESLGWDSRRWLLLRVFTWLVLLLASERANKEFARYPHRSFSSRAFDDGTRERDY